MTPEDINLVILTGLSGSGKSTALHALEDAGFFCVDNLPVLLLRPLLELQRQKDPVRFNLAVAMDLREEDFLDKHAEVLARLREDGIPYRIVFLEASQNILLQRYSQTRRQHPIAGGTSLIECIRAEKHLLQDIRDIADVLIDTTAFTVHDLRRHVVELLVPGPHGRRLRIRVLSFGFKYGLPPEADLTMDVRFIPNPYFVAELRDLDGRHHQVRDYVLQWPQTRQFLERYLALLDFLLPLYEREGKAYLTIAVGCTGGRHRSVTIAHEVFTHLERSDKVISLTHRDAERVPL